MIRFLFSRLSVDQYRSDNAYGSTFVASVRRIVRVEKYCHRRTLKFLGVVRAAGALCDFYVTYAVHQIPVYQ